MIISARILIFFLSSLIMGADLHADDSDQAFDSDLQRLSTAAKNNDFDTPIDMLYSPMVEASGGRAAMKKVSDQMKEQFSTIGLKFISLDGVPPYKRVRTTANDYVIIPTRSIIDTVNHRFETKGYELAIKGHNSSKWEYVEGGGITPEVRSKFFPDLKDVTLPELTRTKLY